MVAVAVLLMALRIAPGDPSSVVVDVYNCCEPNAIVRLTIRIGKHNAFWTHMCNDNACWTYRYSQRTNRHQSYLRVILSVKSGMNESLRGTRKSLEMFVRQGEKWALMWTWQEKKD